MKLELVKPNWPAPANVTAFTTTRMGGVSADGYASLNLGLHVGDEKETVKANRLVLQRQQNLPSEPVWLEQIHGSTVYRIPVEMGVLPKPPVADASITSVANQLCCVLTADCLPVFFTNKQGSEVAIAHAGWRGLAAGVLEATLRSFSDPADQIIAWAGPAISSQHFEVGAEVKAELGGQSCAWHAGQKNGKYFADLCKLAGERLLNAGISWYGYDTHCTYAESKKFFSHRRQNPCGRQASIIYFDE